LDTHPISGVFFMGKYSKQFKLSAITVFLERGKGFRHIAAQFQMAPTLLRRWVAAYALHGEAYLSGLPSPQQPHLLRPRHRLCSPFDP
jgi:transposase-like protein